MQNIDQIRAAHALQASQDAKLKRSAISNLPSLVINNGLLATAAFVNSDGGGDNRKHQAKAIEALADHLKNQNITDQAGSDIPSFAQNLAGKTPVHLQRATAEALSYFSFLKRFAAKEISDNAETPTTS